MTRPSPNLNKFVDDGEFIRVIPAPAMEPLVVVQTIDGEDFVSTPSYLRINPSFTGYPRPDVEARRNGN